MWLVLFRCLAVFALAWAGWHYDPLPGQPLVGAALGVAAALAIIGLEVDEPAADLGVAAAIASSFRNRPLPPRTALFGEVGLGGEVRSASQAGLRVREAAQMGFTRCLLPSRNVPDDVPAGIRLVGVRSLEEALERLAD